MQEYVCINKIRNKSNQITAYILQAPNGNIVCHEADDLKVAIKQKQVFVTNLKIGKGDRLLDKKERNSDKELPYTELTYQFLRPINKKKGIFFRSNVPNVDKEIAKYKFFRPNCSIVISEDKHLFAIEEETSILVLSDIQIRLADTFIDAKSVVSRGVFYKTFFTSIDLRNVDSSHTVDMSNLFCYAHATELNLSEFSTVSARDMTGMFSYYKAKLPTLDVSRFDTSKVLNMSRMFMCSWIKELDLSGFNTDLCPERYDMFYDFHAQLLNLGAMKINPDLDLAHIRHNMFCLACIKQVIAKDTRIKKHY